MCMCESFVDKLFFESLLHVNVTHHDFNGVNGFYTKFLYQNFVPCGLCWSPLDKCYHFFQYVIHVSLKVF